MQAEQTQVFLNRTKAMDFELPSLNYCQSRFARSSAVASLPQRHIEEVVSAKAHVALALKSFRERIENLLVRILPEPRSCTHIAGFEPVNHAEYPICRIVKGCRNTGLQACGAGQVA